MSIECVFRYNKALNFSTVTNRLRHVCRAVAKIEDGSNEVITGYLLDDAFNLTFNFFDILISYAATQSYKGREGP